MLNEDDIIVKAIREYASEGYQITDANGTFIFCNNASSELNGLPLEARLGKSCFELQPEGALAIVLRTGRSVYGHVCSTGNGAIMVANGFPIHDEKGNLVGAISEFTDRTSYVQMAQKLAQNENRLTELESRLKSLTSTEWTFSDLIGQHPLFLDCIRRAKAAADSDATVLVTGESGTGKELFSQAIHSQSGRARAPFIRVTCPAIPSTLLESELFGHEKGAYTGATSKRIGKFESANQGSIFLDEIGDLEYGLQAKLLNFLQEHRIERVGGHKPISLDVRVIAATNQNLRELIRKGRFRQDLYYRLNVIQIHIPPLRSRKSDIPLLLSAAMKKASTTGVIRSLDTDARDLLISYSWPGNVRELENVAARLVLYGERKPVTRTEAAEVLNLTAQPEHEHAWHDMTLQAETGPTAGQGHAAAAHTAGGAAGGTMSGTIPGTNGAFSAGGATETPYPSNNGLSGNSASRASLRSMEEQAILDALTRYGPSLAGKKAAAAELGISLSGLYKKLAKIMEKRKS